MGYTVKSISTLMLAASLVVAVHPGDAASASGLSAMKNATAAQPSNSFVVRNARVFDGESVHEDADVLVIDGIIEQIGVVSNSDTGIPEYPMAGLTLLPAFIDAHTHNSFPNGTSARSDGLRFGVGTHLDMLGNPSDIAAARAERQLVERTAQADMWAAGRLLSIGSLREGPVEDIVTARINEGSDFIKMTIYTGEAFQRDEPTLIHDQIVQIVETAHSHGRMAVAHVLTLNEAQLAINAGVDGLVHLFGNERITPQMIAALRRNDQFVVSTISYLESSYTGESPILEDARIASRLSAQQRQSLAQRPGANAFADDVFAHIRQNLRVLVEAGVPVLIGTDMPNPGTAAGASVHHEMELFVAAGVSPLEALRSATSRPADVFGLHDRGRIREGLRGDLVAVAGNPMEDITATREIAAVWKNGFPVEL